MSIICNPLEPAGGPRLPLTGERPGCGQGYGASPQAGLDLAAVAIAP